jgi:carbamoylphosphate synthase large subunit
MLKKDEDIEFVVVGSNGESHCAYRAVCDEWVTEPIFYGQEAYVDFCVDFCREHEIDVFIPRRGMRTISRRIDEFEAMGVKVLLERDDATMSALCDKAETYSLFEDAGIGYIPAYCLVKSLSEYEIAYHRIKTENNRVCLKLASDEGATSFRVIDDSMERSLAKNAGAKITYAESITILNQLRDFPALLVTPYLSGVEVSVDCLWIPDGEHIIVPRYKSWGRSETIKFDPEIVEICKAFLDKFELRCPCNVQFKYEGGVPYLLEVNPRMSGGIQLGYAATGVNIPNIAVNRLLGIEKRHTWDKKTRIVSFVEMPVLLGDNHAGCDFP